MVYALAPQSRRFMYRTAYVGSEDGDFSTFDEAQDWALDARPAGEWSRILIRDGTYVEQIGPPDLTIIEAVNSGMATFVLPDGAGFSTINTFGGTFLVRGLNFVLPVDGDGSGAYAMHHHPGPNGRCVFDQVKFQSLSPTRPSCAGADTDDNSITYFNECTFDSLGGAATNFHGGGTERGSMYVFKDCIFLNDTTTGYSDLGLDLIGEVWVRGGDVPSVALDGVNVHGWIDPDACPDVDLANGATSEALGPTDPFPPMWDTEP